MNICNLINTCSRSLISFRKTISSIIRNHCHLPLFWPNKHSVSIVKNFVNNFAKYIKWKQHRKNVLLLAKPIFIIRIDS